MKVLHLAMVVALLGAPTLHAQNRPPTTSLVQRLNEGARLEAAGDLPAARRVYESLDTDYPDRADILFRLDSVYSRLGLHAESAALLERRLKAHPGDATARMRYAGTLYALGRHREAFGHWDGLLEGARNPGLYTTIAEQYTSRNLDERAVGVYLKGRKATGQPELFARELAEIAERQSRYVDAVREYLNLLEQRPQYITLVEVRLRDMAQDPDSHRPVFTYLAAEVRENPDSRIIRIAVTFAQESGQGRAGYDLLMSLPQPVGIEGALARLGEHGLLANDQALAMDAYRALLDRTQNVAVNAAAALGVARAAEALGRYDEAEAHYARVVDQYGRLPIAPEASYRLGRLRAVHGDTTGAVEAYIALINRGSHSTWRFDAILDLADLYVATGHDEDAESAYRTIISEQRDHERGAEAHLRLARLRYYEGRFDDALKLLDELLAGSLQVGAVNDALDLAVLVQTGLDQDPKALSALAGAERHLRTGRYTAAVGALEAAHSTHARSPLADRLLAARVEALQGAGRYEEAARVCESLLGAHADSPVAPWAQLTLGDILALRLGRTDDAVSAYEQVLIAHPESVEAGLARERLRNLRQPAPSLTPRETG